MHGIGIVIHLSYLILSRCHTRQFFLAICNANLGEKDIAGFYRIVDICKLLYDLQSDYFVTGDDFSCKRQLETPLRCKSQEKIASCDSAFSFLDL